jgi:hypothetical protein
MSQYRFHYVYRITNLKENKHYYGVRSSNITPNLDLGVKYRSSSQDKNFMNEQKEAPWQFKYKVIKIFNTRKEAMKYETKLHSKFEVARSEIFYNKVKATDTGFSYGPKIGHIVTKETRDKISKANKGNPGFPGNSNPAKKPWVRSKISAAKKESPDQILKENHILGQTNILLIVV